MTSPHPPAGCAASAAAAAAAAAASAAADATSKIYDRSSHTDVPPT